MRWPQSSISHNTFNGLKHEMVSQNARESGEASLAVSVPIKEKKKIGIVQVPGFVPFSGTNDYF